MPLKLMYITNQPDVAKIAENYKVDRIFIDLETIGKSDRQANYNSVKSNHSFIDISKIRKTLSSSELLVRINQMHDKTKLEIDEAVHRGADIIMLPMYRSAEEANFFVDLVNGRAKTILLLETIDAEKDLEKTLSSSGADEIHIGLNDLHIEYKLSFMFQLLANGKVDEICEKIKPYNIMYGFGGIAGLDRGILPGRYIIAEHYRLGSTMAILSRSFCDAKIIKNLDKIEAIFSNDIPQIRKYEEFLVKAPHEFFEKNRKETIEIIEKVITNISSLQNH